MAKLHLTKTEFNGTSSSPTPWTSFTGGSATFSGAAAGLSVVFPATTSSSTDGDDSLATGNDLLDSYAMIKVTSVAGASATHTDCVLRVRQNSTNYVTIFYEAGTLFFSKVVAGSQTNIGSVAYNAVTHLYWRILESNGLVSWQTSPDGLTWNNGVTPAADPVTLSNVDVVIGGLCFGVDTSPTNFTWSNFNVLPKYAYFNNAKLRPRPFSPGIAR